MIRFALASVLIISTFALAACGGPAESAKAPASASSAAEATDIVDTALGAGSFKTLVAAVQAAGLEGTLRSAGPFTVFAPTDEAFAKLPAGTVEDLLKPENKDKLAGILTYHVVAGDVSSSEAVKLTSAPTVNGKELTLAVVGGSLHVGDATVTKADIAASNGTIHVVDTVLLP